MPARLIAPADVMREYGLPRSTAYALEHIWGVETVRFGRSKFYDRASLEAARARHTTTGAEAPALPSPEPRRQFSTREAAAEHRRACEFFGWADAPPGDPTPIGRKRRRRRAAPSAATVQPKKKAPRAATLGA